MKKLLFTRRRVLAMAGATGGSMLLPGWLAADKRIMERQIPSSGETLPVIGLGTSGVFDVGSTPDELAPRREIVRLMVERGGSVIDTSPMYGRAETVSGRIVDDLGIRDRIFFATKVWTRGKAQGLQQMEASRRRLRTDVIDLMQVHNLVDWRTQLGSIRDWQAEGRIRYAGITHYRVGAHEALASVIEREKIDFVQLNYSITTRDAEDRLLPLAADRGVAVIVNRAYEDGRLFQLLRDRPLPAWAADFDAMSWGQFLLKYVLAHPAVTCVIPGTSRVEHMKDNLAAGTGRLPDRGQRQRMVALIESL